MADSAVQFVDQAQDAARALYESIEGLGEIQLDILHRLGAVQQGVFSQTLEAANDQLQLVARVKDPREYATAEADLMKSYGQRYVDNLKQVIDIVADAWEKYGERFGKTVDFATKKAKQATRKAA